MIEIDELTGYKRVFKLTKGGQSLTKCPIKEINKSDIRIGSVTCKQCSYNNGGEWWYNHETPFVYCEARNYFKGVKNDR